MTRWPLLLCLLVTALGGARGADPKPAAEQMQFFESRIRPLLANNCYECHGAKKQNNGLRLDSRAAMLAGGDQGPALVSGKPDESLIVKAVRHAGPKMPPKKQLAIEEIAMLAEWVKQGAPWPAEVAKNNYKIDWDIARKHWAFQPLQRVDPTAISGNSKSSANPIDAFVNAKLQAAGVAPAPPADKRTLLRRATYDLIGLPPTPEEIDAFLAHDSPDAFAKVIDRLLASPHYGERWGRHWLDLVRYADTAGDNSDYPVPQLYKYRNWVIRAFNEDKPYDVFLREQIAGDLMAQDPSPGPSPKRRGEKADSSPPSLLGKGAGGLGLVQRDRIIATGYLANTRRFGSVVEGYPWHLTVEDTIDNLGRTVLGLTVNCARCHDHKFDPILAQDYYGLYGFFQSTRYPFPGIELDKVQRDLVPLVPEEKAGKVLQERAASMAGLDKEIKGLEEGGKKTAAVMKAIEPDKSLERDIFLAAAKKRIDEVRKTTEVKKKEKEQREKEPLPFETAYAVAEGSKDVGNAKVHLRGDAAKLGPEVPRKFLKILGEQSLPKDTKGSGRLQLAEWLTDSKNPLTARVMVNRIWQQHFGRGIVPTPSDFGKQGQPPSHPELLDFLALHFIEHGWSIKAMHRLIMTSATYQQSSSPPLRFGEGAGGRGSAAQPPHPNPLPRSGGEGEEKAAGDPDNRLLAHFPRRRLDAESIRDTMLMLSGALDLSPGGPHPFPEQPKWDFTQHKPFKAVYESNRRSVYLMTQRIQRHPYLALFDGPDTNASTATRITSTTPLQALFLMNDPFVHEQAKKLAERLLANERRGSSPPERIERLYLLAFARQPEAQEQALALEYLAKARPKFADLPPEQQTQRAWESLVRAVLMSNEFVYVN